MDDVKAGVYRHYKDKLYLVLGLAHDANADTIGVELDEAHGDPYIVPLGDRDVVVYIGLQLDDAHTGPRLAVRTYDDFFARVCVNTDCIHYGDVRHREDQRVCGCGNATVQRFEYVGPTWEG